MTHAASVDAPSLGGRGRMSDADFAAIAQMARKWFGLHLSPSKMTMVEGRLSRRLRHHGLPDFGAYRKFLESANGNDERKFMLGCLTTNVTQFFREKHHFDFLRETVLPPAMENARKGGRVRIWSAGCSTGQEPYTIAMSVLEAYPDAAKYDIRILATDIDPFVLETAARGEYDQHDIDGLTDAQKARFVEMASDGSGSARIGPVARELITFAELNLMDRFPMKGPFDAIFCRNVVIYFDDELRREILTKFVNLLGPKGHLFIGHSEQASGPAADRLKRVGPTVFGLKDS